jgi:hypothetical protein
MSCEKAKAVLRSAGIGFMLTIPTLSGQTQVIQSNDLAVLDSREYREDLSCQVTPHRPSLGFDLRFHADYRVKLPVRALIGTGNWLQVVMRVTSATTSREPVYLSHRFPVPDVPEHAEGEGEFNGGFDLGAGRYRVDWMMRDGHGAVCSSHWDAVASLPAGPAYVPSTPGPNMVAERSEDLFA